MRTYNGYMSGSDCQGSLRAAIGAECATFVHLTSGRTPALDRSCRPPALGSAAPAQLKALDAGEQGPPGIAYGTENDVEIAESGGPSGGLSFF